MKRLDLMANVAVIVSSFALLGFLGNSWYDSHHAPQADPPKTSGGAHRVVQQLHQVALQKKGGFVKPVRTIPFVCLCLCLSVSAGAQAGTELHVNTDMNCNWKLDGQPMGVLKDGEEKVVPVSPGYHLIEAFAAVGGVTDMIKVEIDKDEKTVYIQLKYKNDRQPKMPQPEPLREPAAADSVQSETWTDPATGLMWTKKDNGANVDWDQAVLYCSGLQLAGLSGWRLATPEELQAIYDPSVSTQRLFNEEFTVDTHVKGNLKLTGRVWSSRQGDNPGKPYQDAWFFQFGGTPSYPNVGKPISNFLHYQWNMRALCVRRSENDLIAR